MGGSDSQLLIRPLEVYEVPIAKSTSAIFKDELYPNSVFYFKNEINYLYNSGQKIKRNDEMNLVTNVLDFKLKNSLEKTQNVDIEIIKNDEENSLNFLTRIV